MKKKIILLIIVLIFIGWSNDTNVNTPICTAQREQQYPRIAAVGRGETIITWQDRRSGNFDIYAQLIDAAGTPQWKNNGVAVCSAASNQEYPQILPVGSGGAIITWQDRRSGNFDIYAQRINAAGQMQWTGGGVGICTAVGSQENPQIVSDGAGGAVITWKDRRNGSNYDIYAARVSGAGNVTWTADGVPVCMAGGDQLQQQLTTDRNGGAIIAWKDKRGSKYDNDIYAQRINSTGIVQWTTDGVLICSDPPRIQSNPQLTADGSGGAVIVWTNNRYSSGEDYIYGQRINSGGTALWTENGHKLSSDSAYLSDPGVISHGSGGAIIIWKVHLHDSSIGFNSYEVRAQRVDAGGTVHWGYHGADGYGLLVCSSPGYEKNPALISDGSGGAIISWEDNRSADDDFDIYAQRVKTDGTLQWGDGGLAVSTRNGTQKLPRMAADGAGGAVVTWYDGDIYAQNICRNGGIGGCVSPIAVINGDRFGGIAPVTITFDGSGSYDPDGKIVQWNWDLGDGATASTETVTHTYNDIGLYKVSLRVRDNSGRWSGKAKAVVKTFASDKLEVKMAVSDSVIKANGSGKVHVSAACYDKQTDPTIEERPILIDLGLSFSTTAGSWQDVLSFNSGFYTRYLVSAAPGTASISAILEGQVVATDKVEFAWPLPPVNLTVDIKENRSLLRGENYAYLSWSANPEELFTVDKYRIYRSTDGGEFEFAAEVSATVFTYVDASLPGGNQYSYALTMVDVEGDESSLSGIVTDSKR